MISIKRLKAYRGRHPGFPRFNVLAGGPGSLAVAFGHSTTPHQIAFDWGGSLMRWNSAMALLTVLFLGTALRLEAQEEVRTIIEKGIQAHGGEEKLAKVKAVRAKSKGMIHFGGASSAYTNTESWQLPDRIRVVME